MSTRCYIGISYPNNTFRGIYCHSDGYPEYTGSILRKHYTELPKIERLLNLGSISILGADVEPNPAKIHSFDNRQDDVVVAYHRDRDEELVVEKPSKLQPWLKDDGYDYVYLFDATEHRWYFSESMGKKYKVLTTEDCMEKS